jgi:agmatine/peptidylarginine deiminase
MELLAHKKAMWQDKAAHAQDRVNAVNEAIARLEASKPPVKLHELTEDERAELLGKMVCVDQGLHERIFARSLLSEALWL